MYRCVWAECCVPRELSRANERKREREGGREGERERERERKRCIGEFSIRQKEKAVCSLPHNTHGWFLPLYSKEATYGYKKWQKAVKCNYLEVS
jgi:hypothetical protein